MIAKSKKNIPLSYLLLCLMACLLACNFSQENTTSNTTVEPTEEQETETPNGIFRQQKNFTVNSINFTRHQVNIRDGQNEETIIYTVFEDKTLFQPLNDLIADYANLARLDSFKISDIANLETEETQYETVQRIDSVYMPNSETVNITFNYSLMANGMECENRERKFFTYSLKNKKVMTLKEVFGANLATAQEKMKAQLQNQFLKNLQEFAENAYEQNATHEIDSLKQEMADPKLFFANLSFMLMTDSLIFSYPVSKSCSLPPYLSAKMALKDCSK